MKDALGDRMKNYESNYDDHAIKFLPLICRIDGKSFHTLTRGMNRPFDQQFISLMDRTAMELVLETNCNLAYVQSDEISLLFHSDNIETELFFNGRINKINSVCASIATAHFNANKWFDKIAYFDARTFCVPNKSEAVNYFIWRQQDAVRNSLQSLAQSKFSHKQLHGKNGPAIHEMLHGIGVNWNDLTEREKRGTFVLKNTFHPFDILRCNFDEKMEYLFQ